MLGLSDFMINKIMLKNWRSHWESEFNFSQGTNALIGVMGAGKSSLLDSMCFALFGTFPLLQTRKVTLDDIIMNRPQKREKAEVEVFFSVDEIEYSVKRVIERGKGTTKAEIRKEGKLLDTGSSRTTENVEKILKVDYDLFSRAIYSEQNGLDNFLTIPKGQRMRKIDSLLRIDKFEAARSSATTLSNRLKDKIKDSTRLIEDVEEREDFDKIDELKKNIKNIEKKQEKIISEKKKVEELKERKEKKIDEINREMKEVKEKEKELNIISGEIKNLENDLKGFKKDESKNIEKNVSLVNKKIEKERNEIDKKETELKNLVSRENESKVIINNMIERIESIEPVDGDCPLCGTRLTKEHKDKILRQSKEEIKKQEEKLRKSRSKIKDLENIIGELRKSLEDLNKEAYELESRKSKIEEYEKKEKKLEDNKKEKEIIEKELKKIEEKVDERVVDNLQKELIDLSGKYSDLNARFEGNKEFLDEKKERVMTLEEKKEAFEKHKKQIKNMERVSQDLKKLDKSLRETQLTLRREFVDAVNFTMDKIWDYLYPYEDFTNIRLSVKSGDYVLELKEVGGSWVSVEGIASGGERTTSCLALRIAFSLVLAPNLKWLVLDEPTHNLDVQAVEYLAEVLRERIAEFVDQVFLITHDEKLENAVNGYLYRLERKRDKNEPTQVEMISSPKD